MYESASSLAAFHRFQQTSAIYSVKAVVILDSDGKRIVGKYYTNDFPTLKEQNDFEKKLHQKTVKQLEVVMFDKFLVLFKSANDITMHVVGSQEENELILLSVLNAFWDALAHLLKGVMDKRMMLDCMDKVLLALDELVDEGIVLETDAKNIYNRVTLKGVEDGIPIAEQTLSQTIHSAREGMKELMVKAWK